MRLIFVTVLMVIGWSARAAVSCFSEKDGSTFIVVLGGDDSSKKAGEEQNVSFTKTSASIHPRLQTYTDSGLNCVIDKNGARLIGVLCTKTSEGAQVAHILHPSPDRGKFTYQAQAIYPPGYEDQNIHLNLADDLNCAIAN